MVFISRVVGVKPASGALAHSVPGTGKCQVLPDGTAAATAGGPRCGQSVYPPVVGQGRQETSLPSAGFPGPRL